MDGPMAWWYFFGSGIAIVTSIILTWWCLLDAFRHKGSINRFTWPLIAFTGTMLQIPAFTVTSPVLRASGTGTAAALAGVAGFTLVGMSAVAYFSKSSGSGATWFTRTRDNDSFLSGSRERRSGASSARASVPVGGARRAPRTPTPVDFSDESVSAATPPTRSPIPVGQYPADAAAASPFPAQAPPAASAEDTDRTVIVDDPSADEPSAYSQSTSTIIDDAPPTDERTMIAEDDVAPAAAHTVSENVESGVTVIVEDETEAPDDRTLVDEDDGAMPASAGLVAAETISIDGETDVTLSDDPTFATVVDEPDGIGGRLIITDGRSSRIVITERTGPFIVGREPAKASLAVDDPKVSRAHFAISRVDDDYVISDLDSANGTFVNGEMLRQGRLLQDGDTVEFGRTIAKFVIDGGLADA